MVQFCGKNNTSALVCGLCSSIQSGSEYSFFHTYEVHMIFSLLPTPYSLLPTP
ncbi:MAG: hypothetical protein F6K56_17285 [Moorea sp. SIO3G5]|nr:hypothetical protein [Moorena sp. SIO3G5]